MNDAQDFPDAEEFDENEQGESQKKEGDPQHLDFLSKLKRLSDEAEANTRGKQGGFDFPELENEDQPFKPELAGDLQNPKEAYDLYYAIRRLLMNGLPKGSENEALRQMVYDEKNLYLRHGVPRPVSGTTVGADSRQALLHFLRTAYTKTEEWVSRGGSAYDIFLDYYDLNKEMKFR